MKALIVLIVLFVILITVLFLQRTPQAPQTVQESQIIQTPQSGSGGLRLCNKTSSRVSVAIGYKDAEGWITEGWWNTAPGACEILQNGSLRAKFYYIYALDADRGGAWGGRHLMCTQDKSFTIRGVNDCKGRGYMENGFFEIDTGEQSSWVIQLDESGRMGRDQ